mgnify:CR=1 FL=1
MIPTRVLKGYNLYEFYHFIFRGIMFNSRYRHCSHKLLKRFVAYLYVKRLRGN